MDAAFARRYAKHDQKREERKSQEKYEIYSIKWEPPWYLIHPTEIITIRRYNSTTFESSIGHQCHSEERPRFYAHEKNGFVGSCSELAGAC